MLMRKGGPLHQSLVMAALVPVLLVPEPVCADRDSVRMREWDET